MNFLAHLWLADRAGVPLAGAVLGDYLRGALPPALPEPMARSVRLHRRIDAATDAHPLIREARQAFQPGARRYAGIVIDIVLDHILARDWDRYANEPLDRFARRSAAAIGAERAWFERAGGPAPEPDGFSRLLLSYGAAEGIDRAFARTARRLRRPEALLGAAADWRRHAEPLTLALPPLLDFLRRVEP